MNIPSLNAQPSTLNHSVVWDGDWAILEEYDATGNLVQGYLQGYHGLVKTMVANVYYYQDELGSTSHIADVDGNLLEYYKYDLYGKPQYFSSTSQQLNASTYGVKDLFTGQRFVPEIGLYDDRNRFMSPDLGRFLQPDPISFAGDSSNLYRYCRNDWANTVDPMGTEGWRDYPKVAAVVHFDPVAISVIQRVQARAWAAGDRAQAKENAAALREGRDPKHDVANAVRHVYGSAALTHQFGTDIAKKITDIHEQHAVDKRDSSVDQFHNRIGREIGPSVENEKDINRKINELRKEGRLIEDKKTDKRDRAKPSVPRNNFGVNTSTGGSDIANFGEQPNGSYVDAPGSSTNLTGDNAPEMPMSIMTAPK